TASSRLQCADSRCIRGYQYRQFRSGHSDRSPKNRTKPQRRSEASRVTRPITGAVSIDRHPVALQWTHAGRQRVRVEGGLMPNLLEIAGRETLSQLDYIGSLNIQLWATLRGMRATLPLVGNRHRWRAAVHQMLDIGVDALPMVALMAMCSGFILAMQGASEL